MINILHIFISLPVGGAENLLLNTVKGLNPKKFKSIICCIAKKDSIGLEIESLGFSVYELNKLTTGGFDKTIVTDLQQLIATHDIQIVHTHLYHANLFGRLAAKKASIPAISSIHNTYPKRPKLRRRLINWYLSKSTHTLIAGSQEIKNDIIHWDHVAENKVKLIPNTVDLNSSTSELTKEQARDALNIPKGSIVLGTLGRLEEQKGHYLLIDTINNLVLQGFNITLLLIGDGRLRSDLEKQTKQLGLSDCIQFLGVRRDIGDLFKAMDIYIMSSLWEGLSLSLLSAMAAELPVISTQVGGVDEVLGDSKYGLVVPTEDVDSLTTAVKTLINNPSKATTFAQLGRKKVEEHYSDKNLIQFLEKLYIKASNNY